MSNVLVKFRKDYADEFNVYGFQTFTSAEWEAYKTEALKVIKETGFVECYFGTNEMVTFDSEWEFDEAFTVVEISDEAYNVLHKLFAPEYVKHGSPVSFGFIPCFEQY